MISPASGRTAPGGLRSRLEIAQVPSFISCRVGGVLVRDPLGCVCLPLRSSAASQPPFRRLRGVTAVRYVTVVRGSPKMFRIEEKDGNTYIYSLVNKKLLCVLRDSRSSTKGGSPTESGARVRSISHRHQKRSRTIATAKFSRQLPSPPR
ncbi:hypothetical protein BIW11_03909 [Tropilaelaps mercedesae]|uniref:Uncharacterized protein n=1 Tax=Tropilaelaps mercedesae TaxID=418985 RepID=A0A1V9XE30_9ACAR|nr:hypothetical protein BIW11_03909 [Tropilaelaps mercedesae]